MNRPSSYAAALLLAACCACAATGPDSVPPPRAGEGSSSTTLWQLSPFALLMRGHFDGVMPLGEALRHGNLGLAAADSLNGEMAVVNGNVYQFLEGGRVRRPNDALTLPFAILTQWDGGDTVLVRDSLRYAGSMLPALDSLLPTTDAFYAVMITGRWTTVQARTFKKQRPPYHPITPALNDTFTINNVSGTMVGFREPSYADSLSVPNYHLHFVNADGTRGGHVNSFAAAGVVVQVSERPTFTLHMPPGAAAGTLP